MSACPRCGAAGSLTRGAGLADACIRCGWSAEPLRELHPIATWKVLLPLVAPIGCLWGAKLRSPNDSPESPTARMLIGLTFLLVRLWCGWNAMLWHRLSPRYQSVWRPPSQLAPVVLFIVFTLVGAWRLVHAVVDSAAQP